MPLHLPRPARHSSLLLTAAVALLLGLPASAQPMPKLPTTQINIGIHLITAEVAANGPARERGLMERSRMGTNEGMLFVFNAPAHTCMWMKNTLIPLAVAFIDAGGTIINIEEMQAQTTDSHCAAREASFALEMNQHWFSQRNIKPGTRVDGLVAR